MIPSTGAPQRSATHIVDTKASRILLNILNENWLVRNLEERDYGVDLTFEYFDGTAATGSFVLAQLKGTDSAFEGEIKMSEFPVKTIKYSLLFGIPFLAIYVSTISKKAYFVWLQKIAESELNHTNPNWKNQKTVTITFPIENELDPSGSNILGVIKVDRQEKDFSKFIRFSEMLKLHGDSVLSGSQYAVGKACADLCSKLKKYQYFIDDYTEERKTKFLSLQNMFEEIARDNSVSRQDFEDFENAKSEINESILAFIQKDEIEAMINELTWDRFEPED